MYAFSKHSDQDSFNTGDRNPIGFMGISFFFSGERGYSYIELLKDFFFTGFPQCFPSLRANLLRKKLFRLKELAAGCDAELLSSPFGSSMDEGQEGETKKPFGSRSLRRGFLRWMLVEPPFFVLIFGCGWNIDSLYSGLVACCLPHQLDI